jgi:hypothetical protein
LNAQYLRQATLKPDESGLRSEVLLHKFCQ